MQLYLRVFLAFSLVFNTCGITQLYQLRADPGGGVVVEGQAIISSLPTGINIAQQTDRAIIHWDSFSIAAGRSANFDLPTASSAVLNRVVTQGLPSEIFGSLNSNGQVFLINPAGVLIGPSGVINTGGFTASALDIPNADFMRGGALRFQGDSQAAIINQGTIHTGAGGVALIGGSVINQGNIVSEGGSISLVVGNDVTVSAAGKYIQADLDTLLNGVSETAGYIKNDGVIRATGAAQIGGEIYLVNPGGKVLQQGLIAAQQKTTDDQVAGGKVAIDAATEANIAGTIDVSGSVGGRVEVTGKNVVLANSTIDASGDQGGGQIYIGGGFQGNDPTLRNAQTTTVDADSRITVDTRASGNGGLAVIWSDGSTDFRGSIMARGGSLGGDGGFVEISGKQMLLVDGSVSTLAPLGMTGVLLLDPTNFSINSGSGDQTSNSIGVVTLQNLLSSNNVTLQTATAGTDDGDIFVNDSFSWSSNNDLTLLAHRNIEFATGVSVVHSGTGNLELRADSQSMGIGTVLFHGDSAIQFTGGGNVDILYNPTSYASPTDYSFRVVRTGGSTLFAGMLVNNVNDLQAINTNLAGRYALGKDIDASATSGWNGGQGLSPISTFTGVLDGRGHTINGLTINRGGSNDVGLFGIASGATIRDVHLTNVDILGYNRVGGLVGQANGATTITGVSVQGVVNGSFAMTNAPAQIGGLVGLLTGSSVVRSSAAVSVLGTQHVGGLVGTSQNSSIDRSFATGSVVAQPKQSINALYTGGLVGQVFLGGNIDQSHATGSVTGVNYVGGLVGWVQAGTINNSYATGTVQGSSQVGGLVGLLGQVNSGFIVNSYATGAVNGETFVGGLVGGQLSGSATNSFWDVQTSGQSASATGIGKTSAEMKLASTFTSAGWDFTNIWHLQEGVTYPLFLSQNLPGGVGLGGTVYTAAGLPANNVALAMLVNGVVVGNVFSDSNGSYSLVAPVINSDAVLVYLDGGTPLGGTVWRSNGNTNFGLDVYASSLQALGGGSSIDYALFTSALGSYTSANTPYSIGSLVLAPGVNFILPNANHLNLDFDIITDGADILLHGTTDVLGNASLQSGRDLLIDGAVTWDVASQLDLLAQRDVRLYQSVQNNAGTVANTGGILNIVAGWDGTTGLSGPTFNMSSVFASSTSYGNNDGSVFINREDGTGTVSVAVGSRFGSTNLAGYDLTLRAGNGANAFAQLGYHATTSVDNFTIDSPISVRLAGGITALASGGGGAYVGVGHGANFANTRTGHEFAGDIRIHAMSDLQFTASSSYAQLGHNGNGIVGSALSGAIIIEKAQDLIFQGGASYAQLGHGGFGFAGELHGNISLAEVRDLNFTAGTGNIAYVQVGHSGAFGVNVTGSINITKAQDILMTSGENSRTWSQLGHNGSGRLTGNVVITEARNLAFAGGSGNSHAQLGHGGSQSAGTFSGAITLAQSDNLTLVGGSSSSGYAMVGHGNPFASANTRISGNIEVRVSGETSLVNGSSGPWVIGHRGFVFPGGGGVTNSNVLLLTGTLDYNTSTTTTQTFINQDFANKMVANLAAGHVTIGSTNTTTGASGGMVVNGAFNYASVNNLSLLSRADIRFYNSVQNSQGTSALPATQGQVNVVAGWNGTSGIFGTTFSMVPVVLVSNRYGNNDGSVYINREDGTGTLGIAVGSRFGSTNLAAHDLVLQGSGFIAFAQLGFRHGTGALQSNSPITVRLRGDLDLISGTAYAQIGHGGYRSGYADGASLSGDINVVAGGAISLIGNFVDTYAQIGHGGFESGFDGGVTASGNISVISGDVLSLLGSSSNAYSLIGHGGYNSGYFGGATASGNISAISGGGISLSAIGFASSAHIGHGGFYSGFFGNLTTSGNVTVISADALSLIASGSNAYSQIGHGGHQSGKVGGLLASGNITVTSGDTLSLTANGNATAAQIGHGGYQSGADGGAMASGNITVVSADANSLSADSAFAAAQIGHGGYGSGFSSNLTASGNISVVSGGALSLAAKSGGDRYSQVGHGGFQGGTWGGFVASGNISVLVGGEISLMANNYAFAQIGHGGFQSGTWGGFVASGNVLVTSGDAISLAANGSNAYTQIGHGGRDSGYNGNLLLSGNVTVASVGELLLTANSSDSYAQIGHGGLRSGYTNGASIDGNISVVSGRALSLNSNSSTNSTQIGHGGNGSGYFGGFAASGNITILSAGAISLTAGSNNTIAQIGHGGYWSGYFGGLTASGNITVASGGAISLIASGFQSTPQIGHGGRISGSSGGVNASGNITLLAADALSLASSGSESFTHIGHGGLNSNGIAEGDILVLVAGDVTLATTSPSAVTRLGHLMPSQTYTTGNTFIGAGQAGSGLLTASGNSSLASGTSGELRFYIPDRESYQIAAGTPLNGAPAVAPGTFPLPNEQGDFPFATGPYVISTSGTNYAFYFASEQPPVVPTGDMSVFSNYVYDMFIRYQDFARSVFTLPGGGVRNLGNISYPATDDSANATEDNSADDNGAGEPKPLVQLNSLGLLGN